MKKNKLPGLVTILILTLVTAIVWISMGIYRSFTTKPEPVVPEAVSKPITPTLDLITMKNVVAALFLTPSEIPDVITSGSPLPTTIPVASTVPISTPTPTSSATPEATASASPTATPTI
jgi:hypothetical protein